MGSSRMRAFFALSFAITLASCSTFDAHAPQGFAEYDHGSGFRAVSADGVMYRVRSVKNEPKAELPFWREALKKRMLDAGYRFQSEASVKAANGEGYLLELA